MYFLCSSIFSLILSIIIFQDPRRYFAITDKLCMPRHLGLYKSTYPSYKYQNSLFAREVLLPHGTSFDPRIGSTTMVSPSKVDSFRTTWSTNIYKVFLPLDLFLEASFSLTFCKVISYQETLLTNLEEFGDYSSPPKPKG